MKKGRSQCHKASIEVILELIQHCYISSRHFEESTKYQDSEGQDTVTADDDSDNVQKGSNGPDQKEKGKSKGKGIEKAPIRRSTRGKKSDVSSEEEEEEGDEDIEEEEKEDTKANTSSSSSSGNNNVPIPYACLLGALQRITFAVQDRAPAKPIVLQSIMSILKELQTNNNINNKDYADSEEVDNDVIVTYTNDDALYQYIQFIARLSRSNKVAMRAFVLEISSSILNTEWAWGGRRGKDKVVGPKMLLELIIGRCDDAAPLGDFISCSTHIYYTFIFHFPFILFFFI
jgi:hypothetical protein